MATSLFPNYSGHEIRASPALWGHPARVIDCATMLAPATVTCPYCGETFETTVDSSGGDQTYIEDCQVCCRPIVFRLTIDADGRLAGIETRREDE